MHITHKLAWGTVCLSDAAPANQPEPLPPFPKVTHPHTTPVRPAPANAFFPATAVCRAGRMEKASVL